MVLLFTLIQQQQQQQQKYIKMSFYVTNLGVEMRDDTHCFHFHQLKARKIFKYK